MSLLVDAIGGDSHVIPVTVPKVGIYTTGVGIRWTPAQVERFPHSGHVLIDQEATDELAGGANVKDVESGAASIDNSVSIAKRVGGGAFSTYIQRSNLDECRSAMKAASVDGHTYWVADWNLSQAEAEALLGGDIVAVQWASPSSNPDAILPGTSLTLKEANVDLSVTVDAWHAASKSKPPAGTALAGLEFDLANGHWKVRAEAGKVTFSERDQWASAEVQLNVKTGAWRVKPLAWDAKPLG